ncbi:MAG: fibronectin type III domain-containing protein [Clostridiales bacterium]|nr:fibronectin type III domain-containing protein [Clostridiales bacterium]
MLCIITAFGGEMTVLAESVTEVVDDSSESTYFDDDDYYEVDKVYNLFCDKYTDSTIKLSWSDNTYDDTYGYQVVSVSASGKVKEIVKNSTTKTTVKISNLKAGTVYRCAVRAYAKNLRRQKVLRRLQHKLQIFRHRNHHFRYRR